MFPFGRICGLPMEAEDILKALRFSLSQIKWRLKSSAKRRLETDILVLCTGMRPVVMIDYGGKLPELADRLLSLLNLIQKESPVFEDLKLMVIEDMLYLINIKRLAEFVNSSLNLDPELHFVDLKHDPPQMIEQSKENSLRAQITSIQTLFASKFPLNGMNDDPSSSQHQESMANTDTSISDPILSQSSAYIDLSNCMHDTQITIPTLNGWLLGYPVVYLFSKDHIEDAIYNLSAQPLRIFKILIRRNGTDGKDHHLEELMSFTVPYDLSMRGGKETWAESFLARKMSNWETCKHIWRSLEMEVTEAYPQAIVL